MLVLFLAFCVLAQSSELDKERDSFELRPQYSYSSFEYECRNEKGEIARRSVTKIPKYVFDLERMEVQRVVHSRTEINGKFYNTNDRYVWEPFSFSYLRKFSEREYRRGHIVGELNPDLRKFVVGDKYHYLFEDRINPVMTPREPYKWTWAVEFEVKDVQNMMWRNQNEKVFVLHESRKPKNQHEKFQESLVSYFSPRVGALLRAVYTNGEGHLNDCVLKKFNHDQSGSMGIGF